MSRREQRDEAYLLSIMDDALPSALDRQLRDPEEKHAFSEHHQRETQLFLAKLKPKKKWPLRSKVASVLIVMLLLFSVSVEAARSSLLYVLQEFTDHWQMFFLDGDSPEEVWSRNTPDMKPRYWPEGFTEASSSEGNIRYDHEDGRSIIFIVRPASSVVPSYDKDDYIIEETTINSNPAWVLTSLTEDKGHMLIWYDEESVISLYGYVSTEELTAMAESTRKD